MLCIVTGNLPEERRGIVRTALQASASKRWITRYKSHSHIPQGRRSWSHPHTARPHRRSIYNSRSRRNRRSSPQDRARAKQRHPGLGRNREVRRVQTGAGRPTRHRVGTFQRSVSAKETKKQINKEATDLSDTYPLTSLAFTTFPVKAGPSQKQDILLSNTYQTLLTRFAALEAPIVVLWTVDIIRLALNTVGTSAIDAVADIAEGHLFRALSVHALDEEARRALVDAVVVRAARAADGDLAVVLRGRAQEEAEERERGKGGERHFAWRGCGGTGQRVRQVSWALVLLDEGMIGLGCA